MALLEPGILRRRNQDAFACLWSKASQRSCQVEHLFANWERASRRFLAGVQAAAHQTTAQQIQARLPAALELFLLLKAAQVLVFPALRVIAHTAYSGDGVFSIGSCAAFCAAGKRISTATGR